MMKVKIPKFFEKNNISTKKIIVISVLIILFVLRYLIQEKIMIKPIQFIFHIYADFLIANTKIILYFFKSNLQYDYANNLIINNLSILKIDRFYFSSNQIITAFIIILITKSPTYNKIKAFLFVFLILTLYNSLRISLHAAYPSTISVHNWFFNLVLIPRWLIVLIFVHIYWTKFPEIKEQIKRKFNFSEKLLRYTFVKIAFIIVIYHLVVIITFNNYFIINGSMLISFILKLSKYFIDLIGYTCFVNNRFIYGTNASLYMDDACLGIDLMFLFASFIVIIPGPIKHKFWYIPMGLIIIVLLNCARVILIFINLTEHLRYSIPFEIHDIFTYPVLVFTLFLWIIWINKFLKQIQNPEKEIDML